MADSKPSFRKLRFRQPGGQACAGRTAWTRGFPPPPREGFGFFRRANRVSTEPGPPTAALLEQPQCHDQKILKVLFFSVKSCSAKKRVTGVANRAGQKRQTSPATAAV